MENRVFFSHLLLSVLLRSDAGPWLISSIDLFIVIFETAAPRESTQHSSVVAAAALYLGGSARSSGCLRTLSHSPLTQAAEQAITQVYHTPPSSLCFGGDMAEVSRVLSLLREETSITDEVLGALARCQRQGRVLRSGPKRHAATAFFPVWHP